MTHTKLLTDKALKTHLGILYHELRDTEDAGIAFIAIKSHIEAQAHEIERRLPYPVNIILADLPDYEWAEVGRYIEELQTTIETLQRRIAELEVKP